MIRNLWLLVRTNSTTTKIPVSSVKEGTVLKGLAVFAGTKDPVAMKDEDYPEWLWTLNQPKKTHFEEHEKLSLKYLRSLSKKKIVSNSLNKKA